MATLIPKYKPSAANTLNRAINLKLGETLSVKDFGAVGDGATNDTVAIQNAIDYGIANGGCLKIPYGVYIVSQLTIDSAVYTFNIDCDGASFVGNSATAVNGIFDIVNCVDFRMTGSYRFQMDTPANYDAAVRIRAQLGGSQATKWVTLENMTFRSCNVGIYIGDATSSIGVSEINCFGFTFRHTPLCVRLGGSQTGASFIGCDTTSEYTPPDTYLTVPQPVHNSFLMEGGFIKVVGGSIVTDISTQPSIVLTPCNDSNGNIYPTFIATGVHIESNIAQMCVIYNPNAYVAPESINACAIFNSCTGYAGTDTTQDFVTTNDTTYQGLIDITDCNFYAASTRTAFNISSASSAARIKTDSVSLNTGFKNWIGGISGGTVVHNTTPAISAYGINATIATGEQVVKFTTLVATGQWARYVSYYNPATGLFTVPYGSETITLTASIKGSGSVNGLIYVKYNGGAIIGYGQYVNGVGTISLDNMGLLAGDTIGVYLNAATNNTFGAGNDNALAISISTTPLF